MSKVMHKVVSTPGLGSKKREPTYECSREETVEGREEVGEQDWGLTVGWGPGLRSAGVFSDYCAAKQ